MKQAQSRGSGTHSSGLGSRCAVLHSSAFHGERFHSPMESSRGTRSPAPPWTGAIRRAPTEKGPHGRHWEAPAPCFTANAVVGLAVESSSSQECNRQHGMSTRSLQPKTRRFIVARCSRNRSYTASPSRTAVPRGTSRAGVHRRTWQLLRCRRTDSPHSRRDRLRLPSRCFTRNEDQGHYPSISDACRATHSR